MIKIPFSGDSEKTAPLRKCLERTANEMGVSEFHVAMVMSHFLEEVCEQVAKNQVVRIPCFGVFGAKTWVSRKDLEEPAYCYPAFSANVPFRNLVRLCAPPDRSALDEIDSHRRHAHHSSHRDRSGRMPWSAHKALRTQIRAQAKRYGITL